MADEEINPDLLDVEDDVDYSASKSITCRHTHSSADASY